MKYVEVPMKTGRDHIIIQVPLLLLAGALALSVVVRLFLASR
jgi:hypothetical protein